MNRLLWLTQRVICLDRSLLKPISLPFASNVRNFHLHNGRLEQQGKSTNRETNSANTQKKPKISPKITLIAQNNSLSVTSLEEAKKLAKRRDLHLMLVQEFDSKTQRPAYKLVTQAELIDDELKDLKPDEIIAAGKNAVKKSEKTLTIGARISEHDLESRQKNICKWLAKHHDVRILIQGGADEMPKMEKICKAIEQCIKEPTLLGKIQQKRAKGSHIKFNIVPATNVAAATTTTTPTQSKSADTSEAGKTPMSA